MNKTIKSMMVAGLACLAMCGSAMAAPKGAPSHKSNEPAPRQMVHQAQSAHKNSHNAPRAVSKHNDRRGHEVARHTPPPPQKHRRPEPCNRHHRHECHDCHDSWVELGAGIVGGIIGSIIAG